MAVSVHIAQQTSTYLTSGTTVLYGILQHVFQEEQSVHSSVIVFVRCNELNGVNVAGVFVTSVFAGAFAFGIGFDIGVNSLWDRLNKGVSLTVSLPPARAHAE